MEPFKGDCVDFYIAAHHRLENAGYTPYARMMHRKKDDEGHLVACVDLAEQTRCLDPRPSAQQRPTVQVRPLHIAAPEPVLANAARSVVESLRSELAEIGTVDLLSRSASAPADFVIEGGVRRVANRAVFSFELVDGDADGMLIWSRTHESPINVLGSDDHIGKSAARALTDMLAHFRLLTSVRSKVATEHYLAGVQDEIEATYGGKPDFPNQVDQRNENTNASTKLPDHCKLF